MSHKRAESLADLGPVTVDVPVERPDGSVVVVPLRTLTEDQMRAIRAEVVWPEPPIKEYQKIDGEVLPIYDRLDKGYLESDRRADAELSYRALLASLAIEVPGATEADQLAALRAGLGAYAFSILITAVNRINVISAEEIAAVARSFQRRGIGRGRGNGALAPDAGPVAEPATGGTGGDAGLPAGVE